ncbi:MAG: hypothetical protein FWH01_03380 [Oscillospiraceae bacterium]|nr:hypothetical protein [Oscillospiraceae bacterium]
MKKTVLATLCFIMAISMLAACGGGGGGDATTAGAAATTAAGAAATTTAAAATEAATTAAATTAAATAAAAATTAGAATGGEPDDNFNAEGLPIVNTPVTIDVLAVRYLSHGDAFKTNSWYTQLEQDTNVIIDWQIAYDSDWAEKKSIMFASGDIPSVIFGANGFSDTDILTNLDYFIPLNDLIEDYMPRLKSVFEQEPDMKKIITNLDGKIYSLSKRLPYRPIVSYQPFINKVWLDNLGLEVPDTTEDLFDALMAFKEQDANGNGDANDEIPFTGSAGNSFFGNFNLYSLFGANANGEGLTIIDDTAIFVPMTDEFMEAIKYARRMYAEGLMDNEYFTQDGSMANAKRQNPDLCIVGFEYAWTPDATLAGHADEFITIPPPARPDGQRFSTSIRESNIGRRELEISIYCKYPEVVARWADEFYTYDAAVQNYWGPFGVGMEKLADGTYRMLPPDEGESIDYRSWATSNRDFGPKWMPADYDNFDLIKTNGDGLKWEINKIGEPYSYPTFPPVIYSVEQADQIQSYRTDIRTYVGTTTAKWITEGGIESEWDGYISQLRAMGVDDWMAIHQDAYDNYMNS